MAANKVKGIRAALAHYIYSAHQCVEHDNANVLCLGAQVVGGALMHERSARFCPQRWIPPRSSTAESPNLTHSSNGAKRKAREDREDWSTRWSPGTATSLVAA